MIAQLWQRECGEPERDVWTEMDAIKSFINMPPRAAEGGTEMSVSETTLNTAADRPCGCPECDTGVQPGHFACSSASAVLVQFEREGFLSRHYNGTSRTWERTDKLLRSERR
mgnify:CR=1 FL=1